MPNIHISKAINKQTTEIQVPGYITKLEIEYGFYFVSKNQTLLVWNVKTTNHCFNVDLRTVIQQHSYNYEDHFILTLIKLKEDIIHWIKTKENSWAEKYFNEFAKFFESYI